LFSKAAVLAYFQKSESVFDQALEMVEYIEKEVEMDEGEDSDDLCEDWKKFPRFVFKVMNSNTFMFTSLIEMS
jgi:hypothetical protein